MLAPENTLAAFRLAEEFGADGVELDVHLTRDGVPVVIHDETLERTTTGHGPIRRRSAAALRRYDAGSWFGPDWVGEAVPTLNEVFIWAGERIRLNVEIKSAPAGRAVLELVQQYKDVRVLVSSFDHRVLTELRSLAPELPLGFLLDRRNWRGALRRAVAAGAESLHPRADLVSRTLVAACSEAGLAVVPWTVNRPEEWRRLLRCGVTGVFTDDPAGCVAWRQKVMSLD